MLTTTAATLLAVSALIPIGSTADAEAPTPRVDVVTVNGSGCPAGTAEVSATGRTFTVSYSSFFAQAGDGADPVHLRRNCQLSIRVSLPANYTYGLARLSYNGFAHLEAGATALHRVSTYFQGTSPTTRLDTPFTGPMSREWTATYRPAPADIAYSPCGADRNLNINAELRVSPGNSDPSRRSFIAAESSSGTFTTKYELTTRPC
ncbi:DUF4360 domain-containing protein [Saccharothrix coeruleofusca]|uniref:DUF4360 domain-containing protein n=1 Tax=Saccharothrix coeruleofusca TaxID=33919 RepID=A0A918ALD5_9PSEU|nr:DUF4360 domain-containing protein [Saccharothrix coeruleofusca]MBP2333931.1 hypothetical protein [Saccharothrix coeruleofusca]GGP44668.1 hypothetical protein GCM10010185_15490 [Saccharothrix coeruleofusca]